MFLAPLIQGPLSSLRGSSVFLHMFDAHYQKNHVLLSHFFPFHRQTDFFIKLFSANTWKKNRGSQSSFKRKWAYISLSSFVWDKSLLNLLRFVRVRAHVHGLMTRKSCSVAMCNAILRNHRKSGASLYRRNKLHIYAYSNSLSRIEKLELVSNCASVTLVSFSLPFSRCLLACLPDRIRNLRVNNAR